MSNRHLKTIIVFVIFKSIKLQFHDKHFQKEFAAHIALIVWACYIHHTIYTLLLLVTTFTCQCGYSSVNLAPLYFKTA